MFTCQSVTSPGYLWVWDLMLSMLQSTTYDNTSKYYIPFQMIRCWLTPSPTPSICSLLHVIFHTHLQSLSWYASLHRLTHIQIIEAHVLIYSCPPDALTHFMPSFITCSRVHWIGNVASCINFDSLSKPNLLIVTWCVHIHKKMNASINTLWSFVHCLIKATLLEAQRCPQICSTQALKIEGNRFWPWLTDFEAISILHLTHIRCIICYNRRSSVWQPQFYLIRNKNNSKF